MKRWLNNLPIGSRLRLLFVVMSVALILVTTIVELFIELNEVRDNMAEYHTRTAAMIAVSGRAAVAFSDAAFAQRLTEGARTDKNVLDVIIVDAFGSYLSGAAENREAAYAPLTEQYLTGEALVDFAAKHMIATSPVMLDGELIGHVLVLAGYAELEAAQAQLLMIVLIGLLCTLVAAYLVSIPMQRMVIEPISGLASEMATVSSDKNYSRRVSVRRNDELGELYRQFNGMLEEIESRDRYIEGERARLEREVDDRTADLVSMNGQLKGNIEDLRLANEAANTAARSKAMFLANMSHEIRTPMNGVLGMLELIRGTALTSDQHDFVETAYHSGQGLLTLINDILDLSKIEAGKMRFERSACRPWQIVEDVCSILHEQIESPNVEMASVLTPACYAYYELDPTRIRQLLLNLVGNAVKFTREGTIALETQIAEEDGQYWLAIDVVDTGIGIPESAMGSLFDAFTQADGSTTREFGGTGLGLAITKQLVELMGGSIRCQSQVGVGTRFCLRIPTRALPDTDHSDLPEVREQQALRKLRVAREIRSPLLERSIAAIFDYLEIQTLTQGEQAEVILTDDPAVCSTTARVVTLVGIEQRLERTTAEQIAKPLRLRALTRALLAIEEKGRASGPVAESLPRFANAKVLLAEDNPVNQLVAIRILAGFGIDCDLAKTGLEALQKTHEQSYDLVLMDCQMPEMDGYEATRNLRERESGSDSRLPIVALTANAMEDDARQCLEAGMDGYLSKPIDKERLQAALSQWLQPS